MPELPEVESIRRSLLPRVIGRRLEAVEVRERRLRRSVSSEFAIRLAGKRINNVKRQGKYLLFYLDGGDCLLVHFGMSGTLSIHDTPTLPKPHDHVRFRLSDGSEMVFNDPRRFGLLRIVSAGEGRKGPELRSIGADPLDPGIGEGFAAKLRGGRRAIKSVLLDQTLLAGLGNIYVNEALFRAGIRPTRRAHRVRRAEVPLLLTAIRAVLQEAIELGGSSISDYRDGRGQPGRFQLRLRVYQRHGQPCTCCGMRVRRVLQLGRSSFYCPRCQR